MADAAKANAAHVDFVRDDGTVQSLTVRTNDTILEATDHADIDLRYGCREGKCVSCTGRLLEGDVEYTTEPEALSDRQRSEGFVLLCVARPATDCVVEVGKHVLADAFPKLWHAESRANDVDELMELLAARKQLPRVNDVDVEDDHLDHLQGAMALFPNLHQINEAYHRSDGEATVE